MSEFPSLELVHIMAPIGTTYLRQRQAQMKSAEPSTGTSKRLKGDASTTSGTIFATEETYVDPTLAMNPVIHSKDVDPSGAPPLSL
nr:hypothetical protein CFP56_39330 [Quercus suber]